MASELSLIVEDYDKNRKLLRVLQLHGYLLAETGAKTGSGWLRAPISS